jgi:antitoxin StbD
MNTASISQLKINPSFVISQATDYPVAVENRNKIQAYLVGKNLYEKMVSFIEDISDSIAVKKIDSSKGKDFEKLAKELGI